MISVEQITKADSRLQSLMRVHYSKPKGFVGRQLFYAISYEGKFYGCAAFGSATRFLPGRDVWWPLEHGLNNIFYHVEPFGGYPCRNFTSRALLVLEKEARADYEARYGVCVWWLEALVEMPRTGELYRRAGYAEVGMTKGFTCKRVGGVGTDSWSGKRQWDTQNLRPKRVFVKIL